MGLAWAAPRALLQQHRLYDVCILGGANRVMMCAAIGEFDFGARCVQMTADQVQHYHLWGRRFHAATQARIGHIDGRIIHLWHGDLQKRRYAERYRHLTRFEFDPFTDIALDEAGCWRWATPKTEMHQYVRSYFDFREEDGPRPLDVEAIRERAAS